MTISQIESFLTLAETLNYTKASSMLHTTQPNLSKMIMNIEQEVGVQLLIRSKRDVKLTQAGLSFYREMNKTMEQYRRGLSLTRLADSGVHGILRVGFLGTAMTQQLPVIVRRFYEKYPEVRLNLIDYSYSKLTEMLIEGELDVALVMGRELERRQGTKQKPLFADGMCLVVRGDHKFAGRPRIALSETAGEKFVVMDPKFSMRDYELVTNMCIEHDFLPKISYEANTLNNQLMMVECGVGVTIMAGHMQQFASKNIEFIPLDGYDDYFRVSCAYLDENNPCIPKLLDVLEECRKSGELEYQIEG